MISKCLSSRRYSKIEIAFIEVIIDPSIFCRVFQSFFEKVYAEKLRKYFDDILSPLLAAVRKIYGCQHVHIKLIVDCKIALDSREYAGLLLTDLSKAFDFLPHRLLLCKLYNYGLSKKACQLIRSYLYNRKQRVKVGCERSSWSSTYKVVPQDSVLGPILFDVFINDILYKFKEKLWYITMLTIIPYVLGIQIHKY